MCGDMGTRKLCWHCKQASSRVTVASIGPVPPSLKRPRPVNSNLESSRGARRHHRTAMRTSETLSSCLVSRHNALCFHRAMTGPQFTLQGPCDLWLPTFLCKCSTDSSGMTEILEEVCLVNGCSLCDVHFCSIV